MIQKGGENDEDSSPAAQELELHRFLSKRTAATGLAINEKKNKLKCPYFLGFISTGLLASNADQVVKTLKIFFSTYIFQLKQFMVMGSWGTMDTWRFYFVIFAIIIQVFNLSYDDLNPT